jgi:hypothetical protein
MHSTHLIFGMTVAKSGDVKGERHENTGFICAGRRVAVGRGNFGFAVRHRERPQPARSRLLAPSTPSPSSSSSQTLTQQIADKGDKKVKELSTVTK